MTIDDIRAFAHSNTDAFLDFLFEEGPASVAEHLEKKYAADLRDKFAIAALPAFLASPRELPPGSDAFAVVSRAAYLTADAMMAARKEPAA